MSRTYDTRRHWSPERDRAWTRRLALARVEAWEAEIESGRRRLTPALAAALAADRALAARLEAEMGRPPGDSRAFRGPPWPGEALPGGGC